MPSTILAALSQIQQVACRLLTSMWIAHTLGAPCVGIRNNTTNKNLAEVEHLAHVYGVVRT